VRSISGSIALLQQTREDVADSRRLVCESSSYTKGAGMSDEQLREEEDVEGHSFVRPGGADELNPPDPSQSDDDEDDVEGHSFVRPGGADELNPPDPA
jgi:hypothetical protein